MADDGGAGVGSTNYVEQLRESAEHNESIVCMGLDPVVGKLGNNEHPSILQFIDFITDVTGEMQKQDVTPGAFKPNQGFYAKHAGTEVDVDDEQIPQPGLWTLETIIDHVHTYFTAPIILDFKRGDIGKSSENYAEEAKAYKVDAVTVAPYMGTDSVAPFAKKIPGTYVLCRTSNPGAKDFQDFVGEYNGEKMPLYMRVAHQIVAWAKEHPGIGAVVGATYPAELSKIAKLFAGKDIPLLIPGVGGQGGDAKEVVSRLVDAGYDLSLARINSSSGLLQPWVKKKEPTPDDYAKIVVANLHDLNQQIAYKPTG